VTLLPITLQRRSSPLRTIARWLLLIAAALLVVTVAGCMVGPDYQPPTMELPAQLGAQFVLVFVTPRNRAVGYDIEWSRDE
jgi:hypothetical protein